MKIKLASVAVSFGLLLCAPNISAISNLAAGDDLLTAGSVVAVFGLPLIPAGITFGVGAAVNSNKTKGDFGYSYLGSLGGILVGIGMWSFTEAILVAFFNLEKQEIRYLWMLPAVFSIAGAILGYVLSTPKESSNTNGTAASDLASNMKYLHLGDVRF